jgi:hypothetical protein
MRLYLTICGLLLAGCGPEKVPVAAPPPIPPDLLIECPGWGGPTPTGEGQFVDAAVAEKVGRLTCNEKLRTIGEIVRKTSRPQ